MAEVVLARCPGCKNVLRIPANWVGGSLRCKHCGAVMQTKPKSRSKASPPTTPTGLKNTPTPLPAKVADDPEPDTTFGPEAAAMAAKTRKPKSPPTEEMALPEPETPFGQLDSGGPIIGPRYRRKQHSGGSFLVAVVCLLLIGAVAGAVYFVANRMPAETGNAATSEETDKKIPGSVKDVVPDLPVADKPFPRRFLAVSVCNYLYANPVGYGEDARSLHAILTKLCQNLHIPDSQLVELSDAGPQPKAPLKPVIEATVDDFLSSCRAQDRIILLFVGHAVEAEDEPCFVPIEGELGVKDTLIPLKWLYEKLAKCRAREKVLIMDVCRFDPAKGMERPGSGPMAEKLDNLLKNPPAGVEVWSACSAGQYSYEGYVYSKAKGEMLSSGLFLDELFESVGINAAKRIPLGIQKPQEALPIAQLAKGSGKVKGVNAATENEVLDYRKAKQTPYLVGQEPADGASYNPAEPLPEKLVIKPPPAMAEGKASRTLVQSILKETGARLTRGGPPLPVEALPEFSAKAMEEYQEDGAMTPFREEIIKANALLEKHNKALQYAFRGKGDDAKIKAMIMTQQREPARAFGEMQEELEALKKIGEDGKDKEMSLRWQANYDFVLARLEARLANVYEYNFMLGQIRKDQLPPRDAAKHSGWGLASQVKLQSGAEARKLVTDSQKILKKLIKQHQGTPYEILAKRESLNALGLEWQPVP